MNVALLLAVLIGVDQVGYPAIARKIATVVGAANATSFSVARADGTVALESHLSASRLDEDSGDVVQIADFSSIAEPGHYELRVGSDRAGFEIASDPYRDLLRITTRAFYGQRCGVAVDLGDGHSHPACHLDAAFHPSSGRTGGGGPTGGWHDAGDYGRYVVNSGISTGTLLWTCELFHATDLLDEIRWNLDWMLSMQDDDGGVWHKQTSEAFADFVQPQDDHSISYVIGTGTAPFKSSCATGDFAAVMAIASRVYRQVDAAFADRALAASKRAFVWMTAHPNVRFRNPRGVATGEYGDRDCSDERLWAAAELWRTQGDADAHAFFLSHIAKAFWPADGPPDWQNVSAMAAWTYSLSKRGDAVTTRMIRQRSLAAANAIVKRAGEHPYRIPMRRRDYVWGSNGVAANYAFQLLVANEMHPNRAYVETAVDVLHYLFGRNPFAIAWVTGVGTRSVKHPHHRPSATSVTPWPGLLAGGPNRNRQDPVIRTLPHNTPPAKAYVDDQGSYASNEVAINWNAPLVFVLAGIRQKLQGDASPDVGTVSLKRIERRRRSAIAASTSCGDCARPPRK